MQKGKTTKRLKPDDLNDLAALDMESVKKNLQRPEKAASCDR
jgi:hypothetical protein